VPTPHKRIAIIEDDALRKALDSVAEDFDGAPKATVVRRLAIEGATAWAARRRLEERGLDELVRLSTGRDASLDWELLAQIDEQAWGA
jgi:hypothetical protein